MRIGILRAAIVGVFLCAAAARGQMSDEEKKQLFLKARQDIRPVPRASATPRPRPKPVPSATPRPTQNPTPKPAPPPEEDTGPASEDRAESKSKETPKPSRQPPAGDRDDVIPLESDLQKAKPTETPKQRPTPPPRDSPEEAPQKTGKTQSGSPDGSPRPDAPIVIEKSGLSDESGYQPPKGGGGGWFKRYRYLTPEIRRAIDRAPVLKGRWRYIVIHNSGTRQGNAKIFDNYHRRVRKMQNGLAYHFVIGNGNSSGDGQIEVGSRWTRQINGGHVASDYLNNIALGICLVGDFNRDRPTQAQLAALAELVDYLRGRVGKYKGAQVTVRAHKQINPKPTDCPGDRFDYQWLRRRFGY